MIELSPTYNHNNSCSAMLAKARVELVHASENLARVRRLNLEQFYDKAVDRRHAAADRVWQLHCMVYGVFS